MVEKRKNLRRGAVIGGLCLCLPATGMAQQSPSPATQTALPVHSPYTNPIPSPLSRVEPLTGIETKPVTQLVPVSIENAAPHTATADTAPSDPTALVPVLTFDALQQSHALAPVTIAPASESAPAKQNAGQPAMSQPPPRRATNSVQLFGGSRPARVKLPQMPIPDYLP